MNTPPARAVLGLGTAHGKAILMGEHAAVYGAPALVAPLPDLAVLAEATPIDGPSHLESDVYRGPLAGDPRVAPLAAAVDALRETYGDPEVGMRVQLTSSVPIGRGLGSSAASAAAVVGAVADALGVVLREDERFAFIQIAERVAHGNPSGIDARTVVSPSPLWFEDGARTALASGAPAVLVIADTGIPGSTRAAVDLVRARREAQPAHVDAIIDRIAAETRAARDHLHAGDLEALGARMDTAHTLLAALEVSTPELDALARAARAAGALGAKLTGGGRGGCVIALAPDVAAAAALEGPLRAAGAADVRHTTLGAS